MKLKKEEEEARKRAEEARERAEDARKRAQEEASTAIEREQLQKVAAKEAEEARQYEEVRCTDSSVPPPAGRCLQMPCGGSSDFCTPHTWNTRLK